MTENVISPLSPDQKFDYNKYQDETTIKALSDIWKIFGESADLLSPTSDMSSKEIHENIAKVSQRVMNAIVERNVPNIDMQYLTESLQTMVFQVFSVISKQKLETETELLARYLEHRDPGTGTYSREYATLGDLFMGLTKIRNEQGNKKSDYEFDAPEETNEETN